jgi:hypothetical protein
MRFIGSLVVVLSLMASPVRAGQKWPFVFDPKLAADPTGTQLQIVLGEIGLPDLPVAVMQTLSIAGAQLWFWPETAALLERMGTAGPSPFAWPSSPAMCRAHAAFVAPPLLLPGASAACQSTDGAIRQKLADLSACIDVEEPERYVLAYPPATVNLVTMGSIEGMIGEVGEVLSHISIPVGLLPPEFVPTLRVILDKIRHDTLAQELGAAQASYAAALSLAQGSAGCFDPAALASLESGIAGLQVELATASAYLENLRTSGEAAAAQDLARVTAAGRTRPSLPFPSLTDPERKFVAFWLGGLYWRMRGGGLIPLGQTQPARFYFVEQAFTQIGQLVGGQDGADTGLPLYLAVFEGWSTWMGMGHTGRPGDDQYADLVGMSGRGQRQVAGVVSSLDQHHYDTVDVVAGGLQMGPVYFYAWDALLSFRLAESMPAPYGGFIDGPTSIGEFCAGASMGLGLANAMLAGHP